MLRPLREPARDGAISNTAHLLNTLHEHAHHALRVAERTQQFQDAGNYYKESLTFAGFLKDQRHVNGVDIAYRIGGSRPGLLLLHGHPQTHVIWHKIAEQLAEHFTVIAADLRGYGDSGKPPANDYHTNYSKREMARDGVELMKSLGGHAPDLCWRWSGSLRRCHARSPTVSGSADIQRKLATDVRGKALPAGHYIAEETPELLLAEVLVFLR